MNEPARFLRQPTAFHNVDGSFTSWAWIMGGMVTIVALIAIISMAGHSKIQTASLSATELGFGGSR